MLRLLFFSVIILCYNSLSNSQGLFENALGPDTTMSKSMNYQLNGYVRGVYYTGGKLNKDKIGTNSAYGELDLKLRAKKADWGDAFTNFRYKYGSEFDENVSDFYMREAYVKVTTGKLDFLIGKKILTWGRADGFNPTDNLTPKNMTVRSPDEDDRRLGNFILRANYFIKQISIEFNWMPVYRSSVLPYNFVELPDNISLLEGNYPGSEMKNSSWAARINMDRPEISTSVSYFEGLDPNPGIDLASIVQRNNSLFIDIQPRAYRTRIIGADFSTSFGIYGLRGEFAYRNALEDHVDNVYIPWPDLQFVFGIDRNFGNISLIAQYIGRYVLDYEKISYNSPDPLVLMKNEITLINRKFFYQLDKFTHMVSILPTIKLLNETLDLEVFSLLNFTTNEYLLRPKLTYDIGDAFKLSFGGEFYHGEDNTLFKILGDNLNGFFIELKANF